MARVEASPRRGGLTVLYSIEALAAIGLAAALWRFSLPAILVLVAIDGGVAFAARGLLRSEAARLVDAPAGAEGKGELQDRPVAARRAHRANAALNISLALCGVTGPALAGFAVRGFGAPIALLVDAGCFVVSGTLLVHLRPHVEDAGASVRARVAAAGDYLRSTPRLRALIITQAVAMVFFASATPVLVAYAKSSIHTGDVGYGVLLATWGVGMVVGSILFTRAASWLWALLVGGTLAVGVAYVGYAAAPSLAIACVAAVPGGLGNGVQAAAFVGVVQELTPERLLGRMMGVVESARAIAPVIGFSLGGALALVTPRVAFLAAGVASCATVLSFARLARVRERPGEAAVGAVGPTDGQPAGAHSTAP